MEASCILNSSGRISYKQKTGVGKEIRQPTTRKFLYLYIWCRWYWLFLSLIQCMISSFFSSEYSEIHMKVHLTLHGRVLRCPIKFCHSSPCRSKGSFRSCKFFVSKGNKLLNETFINLLGFSWLIAVVSWRKWTLNKYTYMTRGFLEPSKEILF